MPAKAYLGQLPTGSKLKDKEEAIKKIPPPMYARAINKEARPMIFSCNGFSFMNYSSWKLIGRLYFTLTARPDCLPGFHFGIAFTTRIASSSQPKPRPLSTATS